MEGAMSFWLSDEGRGLADRGEGLDPGLRREAKR